MRKTIAIAVLATGLGSFGCVCASDGQQLYDDFRCASCHGGDGRGTGAAVKAARPIAGIPSGVAYASIMNMANGLDPIHEPDNCNAIPSQEEMRAMAEFIASMPIWPLIRWPKRP